MQEQKGFTLVELLVAMAIIAILIGMAVFGINVVQQNARDTQRRALLNDIEIALNSELTAGRTLPVNYTSNQNVTCDTATTTTRVCLFFNSSVKIPLSDVLSRTYNGNNPTGATTSSSTNYCYTSTGGTTYIIGVELEAGGFFYKTNNGSVISSSTIFSDAGCTDNRL